MEAAMNGMVDEVIRLVRGGSDIDETNNVSDMF